MAEQCSLDIRGCEHLETGIFSISASLFADARRVEIILEPELKCFLEEGGHSQEQDSD